MVTRRFILGGTLVPQSWANRMYRPLAKAVGGADIIALPELGLHDIEAVCRIVTSRLLSELQPGETAELYCHSLGGIVGVMAADQLPAVTKVVSLGSSHHALAAITPLVWLQAADGVASWLPEMFRPLVDLMAPVAWCQLKKGSAFMQGYAQILQRVIDSNRVISVASHGDQVVPLRSSLLERAPNVVLMPASRALPLVAGGYNIQVVESCRGRLQRVIARESDRFAGDC
ncbi:hypothetical protein HJC99_01145 [Candidatus Saccharibacteria bacterium]|nr:hypothetical protein [Candidatus Saccharibacteria bacterium]